MAKGRPKGPSEKPPVNTVEPSRCPKCGSTERENYFGRTVQEHAGLDPDGNPYTLIVRRRTRCARCGQVRIDRTFVNDPDDADGRVHFA